MARVDDAVGYQRRAVALAEETGHPALDRMRAFLLQLEQTAKGQVVGTAAVEISGPEAQQWAAELHAALARNAQPGDIVSPAEVERSAEVVIAVIGLVFAGVDTAKTLWDWWQSSRRPEGVTVKVRLRDGTRLDLSTTSQGQLEIAFRPDEKEQARPGE